MALKILHEENGQALDDVENGERLRFVDEMEADDREEVDVQGAVEVAQDEAHDEGGVAELVDFDVEDGDGCH